MAETSALEAQIFAGRGQLPPQLATLHSMQSRDTSREASEVQRKVLRQLGPAARVELAFAMSENAREISITGMMDRDPTLSYAEARARLLERILGADLYAAAYSRPVG